jgi:hypothetical protein
VCSSTAFKLKLIVTCRLKDVEHAEGRLYLVFEWLDKDLKKYMDSALATPQGMPMDLIKVRTMP